MLNFPGRKIYLFTFIRDPVDRIISHCLFDKELRRTTGKPIIEFSVFYTELEKNMQCQWFVNNFPHAMTDSEVSLVEKAKSVLRIFNFITSTKDYNKKIGYLYSKIGFDNSVIQAENISYYSTEKKSISNEYHDQIVDDNRANIQLYLDYSRNNEDMNPFGFDKGLQREFVNRVFSTRKISDKLKKMYKLVSEECAYYGIQENKIVDANTIIG